MLSQTPNFIPLPKARNVFIQGQVVERDQLAEIQRQELKLENEARANKSHFCGMASPFLNTEMSENSSSCPYPLHDYAKISHSKVIPGIRLA